MGQNQSRTDFDSFSKGNETTIFDTSTLVNKIAQEVTNKPGKESLLTKTTEILINIVTEKSLPTEKSTKTEIEIDGISYILIEKIGQGGFGQVYKAHTKTDDNLVAVKRMTNNSLLQKEMENELRFLRCVHKINLEPHPIIKCYAYEMTTSCISVVMELAEDDLLTFWLKKSTIINDEQKFIFGVIIMMYTLRALAFLEKLNIIHGDIKPQNLVLSKYGTGLTIKLIDFGTIEKMNTDRLMKTVENAKAFSHYFASPEFMKRDSNRIISRRLHKKSDVWAAGVMFYRLFLGKLPWKDLLDYENFVNDIHAKDIIVPETGGYKLIIELLLRKNPDDRASAKETLLQMKSHPDLGVIVDKLEKSLHPVDDVYHIEVPRQLREELVNTASEQRRPFLLAKTSQFSKMPVNDQLKSPRISCFYGSSCYRKNSEHKLEFSHPGDDDYMRTDMDSPKLPCRYGHDCYRQTNVDHTAKYSHN